MKKKEAENKVIFVFNHNGKIEKTTLYDHAIESRDETTSPVGVMGRLHIRHEDISCRYNLRNRVNNDKGFFEVWTWGVNGNNPKFIEEFEKEEDAEEFIWEKIYSYDFAQDDQRDTSWFETIEEAQEIKWERSAIKPGIYSVNVNDLIDLGWNIENDDVANAMGITIEEANEYVEKTYHAEITINKDTTTLWRLVNTAKKLNGIDEGGDNEITGDDDQTLKDLESLTDMGKIWNVRIL